mgnify:FL=1
MLSGWRTWCKSILLLVIGIGFVACTPHYQMMGEAIRKPELLENTAIMADGYRLPMTKTVAMGRERAVIVALHGINDHRGQWIDTARDWSADGITTYAYDQRGYGESQKRGIWAGHETLTSDLKTLAMLAVRKHQGVPVFLVGESMGGAVILATLGQGKLDGVEGAVLAAPAVWSRENMNWFYQGLLWMAARMAPGGSSTGRGLGIRASDNIEMLRALGRDPLYVRKTRFDTLEGLVDLMDRAYAAAPKVDTPLLVLYGKRDQLVPAKSMRRTVKRFTGPHRVAIFEDGWHLLFRDLKGTIVRRDVAHWILSGDSALPSGADQRADGFLSRRKGKHVGESSVIGD